MTPWHLAYCLPAGDTGQGRQGRHRWPPQSAHHSHVQYTYLHRHAGTHGGRALVEEWHRWTPRGVHHFTHTYCINTHRQALLVWRRVTDDHLRAPITSHTFVRAHTHTHTHRLGFSKQRVFPLTVKHTPRWPNALLTYAVPAGKT